MLPFEVPAGTTPESFVCELLPREHPALVAGASKPLRGRYAARILGHGAFTLDIDGPRLTTSVGAPDVVGGAGESWATSQSLADFRAFLDEAARTGKAKGPPPRPADAAFQARLATLKGVIRLCIPDLPNAHVPSGTGCAVDLAFGPPGKPLEMLEDAAHDGADVTVTIAYALIRAIAEGADPIPVLKGRSGVRVEGKKHLAIALGIAMMPLVPPLSTLPTLPPR